MAKRIKPSGDMDVNNALTVEQTTKETGAQALARKLLQPTLKNAAAASAFTVKMMGDDLELPGIGDYADHVHYAGCDAANGDLAMVSQMLAAQAITLDSMFAELARRSAMNLDDYINASERYGRLALKAQSNCRATLDTLAKLHQPREQTVRHVHVNEGGQAVIANLIDKRSVNLLDQRRNGLCCSNTYHIDAGGEVEKAPINSDSSASAIIK